MCATSAPDPRKIPDGVVQVARTLVDGSTIAQIAKDFGAYEMTLHKWMCQAAIDDGAKPGTSRAESTELRELRRRNRELEPIPFN